MVQIVFNGWSLYGVKNLNPVNKTGCPFMSFSLIPRLTGGQMDAVVLVTSITRDRQDPQPHAPKL